MRSEGYGPWEWAGAADHVVQVHRGRLSAHAGAGALDDAHVVLAVVAPGQYTDAGDDEQDDASEDHWSAFRFVAHTVVLTTVPRRFRWSGCLESTGSGANAAKRGDWWT